MIDGGYSLIFKIMAPTIIVVGSIMSYGFGHFETREHSQETRDATSKRLERIEDKLDQLLYRK